MYCLMIASGISSTANDLSDRSIVNIRFCWLAFMVGLPFSRNLIAFCPSIVSSRKRESKTKLRTIVRNRRHPIPLRMRTRVRIPQLSESVWRSVSCCVINCNVARSKEVKIQHYGKQQTKSIVTDFLKSFTLQKKSLAPTPHLAVAPDTSDCRWKCEMRKRFRKSRLTVTEVGAGERRFGRMRCYAEGYLE